MTATSLVFAFIGSFFYQVSCRGSVSFHTLPETARLSRAEFTCRGTQGLYDNE